MDILSARKKAAERAKALKQAVPETTPAEPAATEQQPPAEKTAAPLPAAGAAAGPASVTNVPEEAAAEKAQLPESGPAEAAAPVPEIEMLSFRLGEEEYAVMVDAVKEVLKNRDLTPVPNAPDYVLGVMALRGPVLPVIDLSRRLGLPPGRTDEKSRIIVVSVNEEDAGIHVDRVTGVVRIAPEAVRPTPETIEHGAEFLRGIARKDDKLYILLDIEKAIGT
jgi:purine-binding chemotaxis protein CheW